MCKVVRSAAGGWMLPVQLIGWRSTEKSGWLQASKCCLCSRLAGDVQSGPVDCRWVNAACAAGWPEKRREVRSTAGQWMLPMQLVGRRCTEWSSWLQAGECCLCSQLARGGQRGLQVYHPHCVLCKWGWVGLSKHNCLRIVVWWRRHVSAVLGHLQVISYLQLTILKRKHTHRLTYRYCVFVVFNEILLFSGYALCVTG